MSWEIREGDALERLGEMPDESVQCVVTSPPYYGLRDYGTGEWEGGDPACDHKRAVSLTARSGLRRDGREHAGPYEGEKAVESSARPYMSECRRCGARRSDQQIGLEQSPEEYVERLVGVFREVRRVLRDDGVVWLNLGDSYANDAKGVKGAKPKDLLMIPARVALALQADGWWLRSEVIWSKPNPMPESVQDRPTRAHEQIFMLTKSPRYFYDSEAIKEEAVEPIRGENGNGAVAMKRRMVRPGIDVRGGGQGSGAMEWDPRRRNKRSVWTVPTRPYADAHFATFPPDLIEPCILAGSSPFACGSCGAPWRRVTEREDQGYDGSRYGERAQASTGGAVHGGTEHSTLGSSNGTKTGQQRTVGWEPTCAHALESGDLERIATPTGEKAADDPTLREGRKGMSRPRGSGQGKRWITRFEQRHYARQLRESPHLEEMEAEAGAAMEHYVRTDVSGARPVPGPLLEKWIKAGWLERVRVPDVEADSSGRCTVLDPFAGSGTVGVVCEWYGRDFIGLELNSEYAAMARRRIETDGRLGRPASRPRETSEDQLALL